MMLFPFIAGLAAFILLVKPLNNRTFRKVHKRNRKNQMEQVFYFSICLACLSAVYLFLYLET